MQRTGRVAAVNSKRGMVAIETDDGYTIIETLSHFELEVGDSMAWDNGYGLGSYVYQNLTQGTRAQVFVQNHAVNKAILRKQLLY